MKAQISFVEFITAMTIFIGAATYISFQVSSFMPNYINEVRSQRLRSEAFQISELLINDPGYPIDWYKGSFDNVKKIGLSDETKNKTNLISGIKLSSFFSNCSRVREKLDVDYNFLISFKNITGSITGNCISQTQAQRAINITIVRVVAYVEGNEIRYGELMVQVW
ncbi:MAG: hypothetical protein QXL86_00475 [Candidatus Aenigmatarchaeota archaeon]